MHLTRNYRRTAINIYINLIHRLIVFPIDEICTVNFRLTAIPSFSRSCSLNNITVFMICAWHLVVNPKRFRKTRWSSDFYYDYFCCVYGFDRLRCGNRPRRPCGYVLRLHLTSPAFSVCFCDRIYWWPRSV